MNERKNILVVEDEADLGDLIAYNLNRAGFSPTLVRSGRAALDSIAARPPDLILLDVMLPEFSGTEIASRVRSNPRTTGIPIIMVTAKGEELDQIVGLAVGADDYIPKPFSMKVLIARVEAVLRRSNVAAAHSERLTMAGVSVDLESHDIRIDGEIVKMTLTEFRLIVAMMQANGKVLSRTSLMTKALGPGVTVTERTIDVHMTAVRKKLGPYGPMIKTVRGVGYRVSPDQEPGDGE